MADTKSIDIKLVKEFTLPGDLLSVARVPGTDELFFGGFAGKLSHVDLSAEKPEATNWDAHVSYVSGLALTAKHLVSSGSDHQIIWWNRESRERVKSVSQAKWVRHLALSSDGQLLASVCDDMVGRLWEADTGKPIRELRGHEVLTPFQLVSKLYACVFSRDGKHLATADQTGHAKIWEVATGKQLADVHAPLFYTHDTNGHTYGGIRSIDFSPDGKLLALGGNRAGDTSTITGSKSLIQVYDWQQGILTHDLRIGGDFFYERVKFHHEGKWLLGAGSAGKNPKLVIFDLESKAMRGEVAAKSLVFDLALSEKSDVIYTVGRGRVAKWNVG